MFPAHASWADLAACLATGLVCLVVLVTFDPSTVTGLDDATVTGHDYSTASLVVPTVDEVVGALYLFVVLGTVGHLTRELDPNVADVSDDLF